MLGFMVSWDAQADCFEYWLSLVAEPAFVFDVHEPGSRRGAQRQADQGRRMSERSEFGAPRLTRAPQGIRPFGPDGGLGGSVFGYFFHEKSNSHQLAEGVRRNAFDFEFPNNQTSLASEAGGATACGFKFQKINIVTKRNGPLKAGRIQSKPIK